MVENNWIASLYNLLKGTEVKIENEMKANLFFSTAMLQFTFLSKFIKYAIKFQSQCDDIRSYDTLSSYKLKWFNSQLLNAVSRNYLQLFKFTLLIANFYLQLVLLKAFYFKSVVGK